MERVKVMCPKCGANIVPYGPKRICPACNYQIPGPSVPPPAARSAGVPPPPPPPPRATAGLSSSAAPAPPPAPAGPALPERMKANKLLVGRVCPACANPVQLGEDVWNCPQCRGTMHQACRNQYPGCVNPACPSQLQMQGQPAAALGAAAGVAPAANAEDMSECKYCGEKILKKARKCRFCGEYQSALDRDLQQRRTQSSSSSEDESLSAAEVVFGILCGLIACIVAIVWIIQGKKKGWKLLLVTVIAQFVFGIIQVLAKG